MSTFLLLSPGERQFIIEQGQSHIVVEILDWFVCFCSPGPHQEFIHRTCGLTAFANTQTTRPSVFGGCHQRQRPAAIAVHRSRESSRGFHCRGIFSTPKASSTVATGLTKPMWPATPDRPASLLGAVNFPPSCRL